MLTLSALDLGKIPYPSALCKGRQPASLFRAYNGEPASVPRGLKLQPMQKTRVSAAGYGRTRAEPVWPATAGLRLKGLISRTRFLFSIIIYHNIKVAIDIHISYNIVVKS